MAFPIGGGVINRVIMTSDSKGFEKLYPRVLNYLKVEKKIKMKNMKYLYLLLCTLLGFDVMAQTGQPSEFTQIRQELQKKWPDNRTVNLVFHGHSVPSGYANTPNVKTLQAYPHQVLEAVKEIYPYAVVNSITTSIGGENAEQGAKRFKQEVLPHRPDILFIDYALNDRSIGLERALKAWEK